jgi:hypothetical protein
MAECFPHGSVNAPFCFRHGIICDGSAAKLPSRCGCDAKEHVFGDKCAPEVFQEGMIQRLEALLGIRHCLCKRSGMKPISGQDVCVGSSSSERDAQHFQTGLFFTPFMSYSIWRPRCHAECVFERRSCFAMASSRAEPVRR